MTTIIPTINPDFAQITLCDENQGVIGVIKSDTIYIYDYEMHLFEESL